MCQRVFGSVPSLSAHKMTAAHTSCDTHNCLGIHQKSHKRQHPSLSFSLPPPPFLFLSISAAPRREASFFPTLPIVMFASPEIYSQGNQTSWTQNPEAMRQTKFPFVTSASSRILSPWHKTHSLSSWNLDMSTKAWAFLS